MDLNLAITPVAGIWIAFAVGAAALTAVVLKARPVTRGNAVLAALLLQQAAGTLASLVAFTATSQETAFAGFHLGLPVWILWSPLVFLAAPFLLGNAKHAKVARVAGIAGALPNVVLLAAWPLAPGLVISPDGSALTDVAGALLQMAFVGFAATTALFAWEAFTTPLPTRRAQFALLACAFSVEGMFHAAQNAAMVSFGLTFHGADHATLLQAAVSLGALGLFLGVCGGAARAALTGDPERMRWARILLGFLAASALTGALTAPVAVGEEFQSPFGAFHAVWDLAALCLITFAGLRFQLFGIERRAQQGIAVSAAVGIGFISFVLVSQFFQDLIQSSALQGLPAPGYLAAVVVGVAGVPITKVGAKVGKRVLPDVSDTVDYEAKRRSDIYRAALEGALADGIQTPKESRMLRTLREQLGVSEAEHEVMEVSLRATLAAAAPAGAVPA